MHTFARALVRRSDHLAERIARFCNDPLLDAHPSHFDAVPSSVGALLRGSMRARVRLAPLLNLQPLDPLLFADPRCRLALVDGAQLRKAALWAGAAVFADALSKVIDGPTRAALRDTVGADAMEFALKRSRLILGGHPILPLPEFPGVDVGQTVAAGGRAVLQTVFSGDPTALIQRVRLKFPAGWDWTELPKRAPQQEAAWLWMRKLLLKEIEPEWAPCFV